MATKGKPDRQQKEYWRERLLGQEISKLHWDEDRLAGFTTEGLDGNYSRFGISAKGVLFTGVYREPKETPRPPMKKRWGVAMFLVGWLLVGVIGSGFTRAYFQGMFPENNGNPVVLTSRNELYAVEVIMGPIAIPGTLFQTEWCKYGWTLLPPKETKE